uniref:Uncharacterized protein n=1 Tax=Anguilla anguilla TaxID=7936 RepID=A0A0E9TMX2_ANGAN
MFQHYSENDQDNRNREEMVVYFQCQIGLQLF